MTKTLIINAHPDYRNENSYSKKMQEMFERKFKLEYPNEDFDVLNLYEESIPRIEEDGLLTVWNKQLNNLELTAGEVAIAEKSEALLDQFISHHRIVIVSPLHNFNVTSRLKDYMDNILIARKTFRYTEWGSEGLMTDDYKVLLLQASGGIYTNNDRYTPLEFYIARAQGTTVQPVNPEEILKRAEQEIVSIFDDFYAK